MLKRSAMMDRFLLVWTVIASAIIGFTVQSVTNWLPSGNLADISAPTLRIEDALD